MTEVVLVDVFDREGQFLATYPMTLGGALGTEDDYKAAALRDAVADGLVSEEEVQLCRVHIRTEPD